MMGILDIIDLSGIVTDAAKDRIKDAAVHVLIQNRLAEYIDEQRKYNENCSHEEEIDFEGLARYICGQFTADVEHYLYSAADARPAVERGIAEKAKDCARARPGPSGDRTLTMIGGAFETVKRTLLDQAPAQDRMLHNETRADVIEKLEEKGDEIIGEIRREISALRAAADAHFPLDTYISQQRERIRNMAIFPWFNESPRYREVFPELFVPPVLWVREEAYGLKELLDNRMGNIAVLGDAGAGKSTLLRYLFAFPAEEMDAGRCLYLTARDAAGPILGRVIDSACVSGEHLLIFIDGIDEQFHDDYQGLVRLISVLRAAVNCHFWLGCRTDFYKRSYSENTALTERDYTLQPWSDGRDGGADQIGHFISKYSEITGRPDLAEKVDRLLSRDSDPLKFKSNPFQLALLVFLAEQEEASPIRGIYDLYERFIRKWLDKERKRGTCKSGDREIIGILQAAAGRIYDAETFPLDAAAEGNTAVTDLLIIEEADALGTRRATAFYHRSLAAFFLARTAVEAMLRNDTEQMERSFAYKLKDDVTNFVGDKIAALSPGEKETIRRNLEELYDHIAEDDSKLGVKEQSIYFITRLGIDVSDFLIKIIKTKPENPIMRLTLAYGCVLSDREEARDFALDYARSIAEESLDAVTNRAWTVVYFGDVNGRDPYTYQDGEGGSWRRARQARIRRFTKKDPRPKDYRFRLFDIPLFHSFLKSRNWDDLSREEFDILQRVDFPSGEFRPEEIEFLERQRELLLDGYARRLGAGEEERASGRAE